MFGLKRKCNQCKALYTVSFDALYKKIKDDEKSLNVLKKGLKIKMAKIEELEKSNTLLEVANQTLQEKLTIAEQDFNKLGLENISLADDLDDCKEKLEKAEQVKKDLYIELQLLKHKE